MMPEYMGWIFGCTSSTFHKRALGMTGARKIPGGAIGKIYDTPDIGALEELFYADVLGQVNSVLFLPYYSEYMHKRFKEGLGTNIKSHFIGKESRMTRNGDIRQIFGAFREENMASEKVVVADMGCKNVSDFLVARFGGYDKMYRYEPGSPVYFAGRNGDGEHGVIAGIDGNMHTYAWHPDYHSMNVIEIADRDIDQIRQYGDGFEVTYARGRKRKLRMDIPEDMRMFGRCSSFFGARKMTEAGP